MEKEHGQKILQNAIFSSSSQPPRRERRRRQKRDSHQTRIETHRHKRRVLPSPEVFQDTHLKLPQGVVTLLLPRGLLGTQHDELIDALCHSSRAGTEGSTGLGVTASSYYFMWWHISAFSSAEVGTDYLGCDPIRPLPQALPIQPQQNTPREEERQTPYLISDYSSDFSRALIVPLRN